MGALSDFFGNTARVRVLEAVAWLSDSESFSLAEMSTEAEIPAKLAEKEVARLLREGVVERVQSAEIVGAQPMFRVQRDNHRTRFVRLLEAALETIPTAESPVPPHEAEKWRAAVKRRFEELLQEPLSTLTGGVVSDSGGESGAGGVLPHAGQTDR